MDCVAVEQTVLEMVLLLGVLMADKMVALLAAPEAERTDLWLDVLTVV
jgi:hypothetical protein